MDLRQLTVLCAVADHRGFSAAARALHTAQSNVSTHVGHLERELGARLVDRRSGAMTDVGALVVRRARRVQAELDALAADVASVAGHIAGGVRLGVIGTTARWLVPPLLDVVGAEHERIALVVVDATTTSLVPQVTEGRLDLAVVNLAVTDPDAEAEPLFDEDRLLVVPADHPLADRDGGGPIDVADLAELDLLLEPKGTAFRDGLDADAARAGVALRPLAEVDGMQLVSALAFEGYGPAILPATAVPARSDGRWRKIEVLGITPRSVGLVTRRRAALSTPAGAVREVLHRVVAHEAAGRAGLRVTGAPRP